VAFFSKHVAHMPNSFTTFWRIFSRMRHSLELNDRIRKKWNFRSMFELLYAIIKVCMYIKAFFAFESFYNTELQFPIMLLKKYFSKRQKRSWCISQGRRFFFVSKKNLTFFCSRWEAVWRRGKNRSKIDTLFGQKRFFLFEKRFLLSLVFAFSLKNLLAGRKFWLDNHNQFKMQRTRRRPIPGKPRKRWRWRTGLPDFSWYNIPKLEKYTE
jgi:hypothetical protein